jgi:hypothetical protein
MGKSRVRKKKVNSKQHDQQSTLVCGKKPMDFFAD